MALDIADTRKLEYYCLVDDSVKKINCEKLSWAVLRVEIIARMCLVWRPLSALCLWPGYKYLAFHIVYILCIYLAVPWYYQIKCR